MTDFNRARSKKQGKKEEMPVRLKLIREEKNP